MQLLMEDGGSARLSSWDRIATRLPAFISLFVVVVPFIHGMNRHLDECYLRRTNATVPSWALLSDFLTFFVESALIFATAATLKEPRLPFGFLGTLLLIDVIWALQTWIVHYRRMSMPIKKTPLPWMLVNAVSLTIGLPLGLSMTDSDSVRPWALMGLAIARTVADYASSWSFYFPTEEQDKPAMPGGHAGLGS